MNKHERISNCVECGKELSDEQRRRRKHYCSDACRIISRHKKYSSRNNPYNLPTATVGALSELKVAVDLLSRGYSVFRALSPSCSCDLAVLQDHKLLRVEVKTGAYSTSGKVSDTFSHNPKNYDVLAIVLSDQIVYRPPLAP